MLSFRSEFEGNKKPNDLHVGRATVLGHWDKYLGAGWVLPGGKMVKKKAEALHYAGEMNKMMGGQS